MKKKKHIPRKLSTFQKRFTTDIKPLDIPPSQFEFNGSDIDEPKICSAFMCRRKLSFEESLYGDKCIHHQNKKPVDVMDNIKPPYVIKKSA